MDLETLAGLLLLVLAFAVFWRGRGVRELAYRHAQRRCVSEGVQLLDDQVAFAGWRWQRGNQGQRYLVRSYVFEFSVTGTERLRGWMSMRGRQLAAMELAPYPVFESAREPEPESEPDTAGQVIEVDFVSRERRPTQPH